MRIYLAITQSFERIAQWQDNKDIGSKTIIFYLGQITFHNKMYDLKKIFFWKINISTCNLWRTEANGNTKL